MKTDILYNFVPLFAAKMVSENASFKKKKRKKETSDWGYLKTELILYPKTEILKNDELLTNAKLMLYQS